MIQPLPIRNVAVIGAGSTGMAVAAHLANMGLGVTVLDVGAERAEEGVSQALQAKPPLFYTPEVAQSIRCASVSGNLDWATAVDWICEAIVEDFEAKNTLYAAIDPILPAHAVVSSCTTTLQLSILGEGRSPSFGRRFFGTHFPGTPRYSKLLELTETPRTDPEIAASFARFLEDKAGRRVVRTKDTAGFIATRIGLVALLHAIRTTEKLRLPIELVDEVTAAIYGKGVFQTVDALGLDFVASIARPIAERCQGDPENDFLAVPASMSALIAKGCMGDKSGRGYYRREGTEWLVSDTVTGAYREKLSVPPFGGGAVPYKVLREELPAALASRDEIGEFLRNHLPPFLRHVDRLKDQIAFSVVDVDRALTWGFGFAEGPFAMMDAVGHEAIGVSGPVFYESGTYRTFTGGYDYQESDRRYASLLDYPVQKEREELEIRDIGDDVKAVSLKSMNGVLRRPAVEALIDVLAKGELDRFVLRLAPSVSEAAYDLPFLQDRIASADLDAVDKALEAMQALCRTLSRSRCVAAVSGHCVGPIFELAMSCPRLAAHPETIFGLPAIHAGLIPAGGGTALLRLRSQSGGAKAMTEAAVSLIAATTSTCAEDGRRKGFLRELDKVIRHPDRLLFEAKLLAQEVEPQPPETWRAADGPLSGMIDREKQQLKNRGGLTAHDEAVAERIKHVFAKANTFEEALAAERRSFIELCGKALTVARIRHLVAYGKPMRN